MADDNNNNRLDLVQRLAEKQNADKSKSLAERAAEKLAAASTASKPAQTETPRSEPENSVKPHASNVAPDSSTDAKASTKEIQRSTLNFCKMKRAGYITPDAQQSHLAEEFRAIKRPLLLNAFGGGKHRIERGNVILVTSAQPHEGKTFTTINLAMSIASERDLHVLVIDTDVYRHRLEEELDLGGREGLVA